MNRSSDQVRLSFHYAREEAGLLGHNTIGPEHLLLGLMRYNNEASQTIIKFGSSLDKLRTRIETELGIGKGLRRDEPANISPGARQAMILAGQEQLALGDDLLDCKHLLLGIIKQENGLAYEILHELSPDLNNLIVQLQHSNDQNQAQ